MTVDIGRATHPDLDERRLGSTSVAEVIDVVYPRHTDFDTHEHSASYLCLVLGGAYDEWTASASGRRIGAGKTLVYPRGSRHAVRTNDEPVRIVHATDPTGRHWEDGHDPVAVGILWQLAQTTNDRGSAAALHVECLLHELTPGQRPVREGAWLDRVRGCLREEYRRSVSLRDLAALVSRHPAHLARAFRARWGMTPGEYLRRVRVAAAVQLLAESGEPLSVIALESGFADQSHMGRWVKAYTGLAPGRLRGVGRAE